MSVLTLSPDTYNYIRVGIERAAYNSQCDEFYYYSVKQQCENKDIQSECLRLVKSWADMNEKSYCLKYNEKFHSLSTFINPTFTKKPLTPVQLLKYVECLSYNIELEHWEQTEQETADYSLLKKLRTEIGAAIIGSLPEYKNAAWSD